MLLCISLSLKSNFGNYYKFLMPSYFSTTLYINVKGTVVLLAFYIFLKLLRRNFCEMLYANALNENLSTKS